MKISMILARSLDNVIGINNTLPWHCPADLKNFKSLTEGKVVVMGKNTWNSLPRRPLPNRKSLVISKSGEGISGPTVMADAQNLTLVSSIDEAIHWAKLNHVGELMFIGGATIYNEVVKFCDVVHLTEMNLIMTAVEGDKTYFDYPFVYKNWPNPDGAEWDLLENWTCLDGDTGAELFVYKCLARKR